MTGGEETVTPALPEGGLNSKYTIALWLDRWPSASIPAGSIPVDELRGRVPETGDTCYCGIRRS